jgi:Ca-activated chloride channel family protein
MRCHGAPALLLLVLLAAPAGAAADPERGAAPYFVVEGASSATAFPLTDTRVRFEVNGVIARVRLQQTYENHGATPIEAVYVFPGSTQAAVHGMRMKIGERVLEARIDKRAKAEETYQAAKEDGRHAGLLTQERANVFTMRVANIRPQDKVEVEVEYTEHVRPTDGTYELVVPGVVGPRYTGEAATSEAWTANPHLPAGQPAPFTWSASGHIRAGLPVAALSSPSHTLSPRFLDAHAVGLEVSDEAGGDRDFVLRYKLGGAGIETGLLLFPGAKEQFFLLTVAPPKRVAPSAVVPREYVFIVDVSGSMSGFPIQTAQALLQNLVKGLGPQDRFNVVLFAGGSTVLAPQSVPATPANVDQAARTISSLHGSGGTELLAALKTALALPRADGLATSFVLITDGYVNVEREALELVSGRLGEANLFSFGIGSSVNRALIESLARAGMGEPFVVLNPKEAEPKAQAFLQYIEQPVLTDLSVGFEGFDVYDVEPPSLPDLFASRPVVVFGKYRGQPSGRITVRGAAGTGPFVATTEVTAAAASDDLGALAKLWARHRVGRLADLDAAGGGAEHEPEITRLGLQYDLLTDYTAFVAVSPDRALTPGERATTVRQALPMPQGVSNQAVHGGLLGVVGTGRGGGGSSFGVGGLGVSGVGGYGHGSAAGAGKMGKKDVQVRAAAGTPVVLGSLSKDAIHPILRRQAGRFRHLYERALQRNPSLSGKIVVRFTIDGRGQVVEAAVTATTVNDAALEAAIVQLIKKLRFPAPEGGGKVVISYPLIFRADG